MLAIANPNEGDIAAPRNRARMPQDASMGSRHLKGGGELTHTPFQVSRSRGGRYAC